MTVQDSNHTSPKIARNVKYLYNMRTYFYASGSSSPSKSLSAATWTNVFSFTVSSSGLYLFLVYIDVSVPQSHTVTFRLRESSESNTGIRGSATGGSQGSPTAFVMRPYEASGSTTFYVDGWPSAASTANSYNYHIIKIA